MCASASFHPTSWHSINWKTSHVRVRKLQVRIAKAAKNEQWRRVKALQRLLTRSFTAKVMAIKRVTENTGKKTLGVDGVMWNTPEKKWNAIGIMKRTGYRPKPLRRIYIPKANGKRRPLGIPTLLDRAMQALHLPALEPVSEITADKNSYGFRPLRSAADAIEQIFCNCAKSKSAKWVLEADIEGCFDNISHDFLINTIPMDKVILGKWLKSGLLDRGTFYTTNGGTPQGGIISPTLANMALDGLEAELRQVFGYSGTAKGNKHKVHYVRYADDFVITGISHELLESRVKPLVEGFMAKRGLRLSQEKTGIIHISEGFNFLGQNVRSFNGKFLITPAKKNLTNFLKKMRTTIKEERSSSAWKLITKFNPIIRGWVNYHRHVVAKKTFSKIDHLIWQVLWKWCLRRHPKKGKYWVRKKYFTVQGNNQWVFSGKSPEGKRFTLYKASSTPIKRHIKIRSEACAFDKEWEIYFEKRLENTWKQKAVGNKKVSVLWRRQDKRCLCCNQLITQETGWNIHHKVERVKGGGNELSNLELLHPNCHRQKHSRAAGYDRIVS
ncbi:group II intron reverse transcriptase/maturase [Candidatus Williamhamiltonella defendens]|uniref:Group II intron reverse transcriptase/maturase n=2 Tax=Enterobacterales TaxID=91347 RepID=A0A2D3T572_9ENTR|nr:group II intron reverse transcriptase/maturase [Candidatus Hamiltonella defensa]ATW30681.1 group II intron reverse transcriptase/maturase [Candidatus Hamiltonella defensa]ATW30682.1 group II intron reverse transcriptase/maturase [Candidatus Hamiltonella defensa]ATW32671.1 group II intron reverse transcriptase/maturase [Candidatus Hamiltonella defensa]